MTKKYLKKPTKLVHVDVDVAELAAKIASLLGKSVSDLLSKELRPILRQLRAETIERLSADNMAAMKAGKKF